MWRVAARLLVPLMIFWGSPNWLNSELWLFLCKAIDRKHRVPLAHCCIWGVKLRLGSPAIGSPQFSRCDTLEVTRLSKVPEGGCHAWPGDGWGRTGPELQKLEVEWLRDIWLIWPFMANLVNRWTVCKVCNACNINISKNLQFMNTFLSFFQIQTGHASAAYGFHQV